jgi:hypothetical protein
VKTDLVQSRCPFGIGLVIPQVASDVGSQIPPVNGAPYYVVAQAQLTSQSNGGPTGIYWKVNRDTTFRAQSQDLIGSWICRNLSDLTYPPDTPYATVIADLQQNGFQYITPIAEASLFPNGSYSHFVVWSSSVGNDTGTTFDIRASIDLSASTTDPKVIRNYLCEIYASEAEWILNSIDSSPTLQSWVPGFQGSMYDGTGTPAANDTGGILERYLNSMIMVAGGGNFLLSTSTEDTQGCLVSQTSVPLLVVILFSLVGVATALFAASAMSIWIWFHFRAGRLQSLHHYTTYYKDIDTHTPDDLVSWMAHATRESAMRESHIKGRNGRDLTDSQRNNLAVWEYGPSDDGAIAVLRRRGEEYRAAVPASNEHDMFLNTGVQWSRKGSDEY